MSIEQAGRAIEASASIIKMEREIERQDGVIEELTHSLDIAKYDEPELRAEIERLSCEGERKNGVIEEKNEALQEAWSEIRKINGSVSEGQT